MSIDRDTMLVQLAQRLGDTAYAIWPAAELEDMLDTGVEGLYPSYFDRIVDSTTAGAGPIQTLPTGCRNIYYVGYQRSGANRVRSVRNWKEGDGDAYIPKTGITGDTLMWAWTQGWDAPVNGSTALGIPTEAREIVILRSHIAALESLLSSRVKQDKFYALTVRPAVTEEDVLSTLEALHASVNARLETVVKLPEIEGQ